MKISERHVQAIWYDAALRPDRLYTRRGSAVRVVSPGIWNLGAGPDFKGAILEVGKEMNRVVGDVEVHLCPNDWDIHGHGKDPKYKNVIAHVTWGCGPVPTSLPHEAVSIWLGRFMLEKVDFSPRQIDLAAYPYARLPLGECVCEKRIGRDPDAVERLLVGAGRRRLRLKARRIVGRLGEGARRGVGREQVFYEEVLAALGYKGNDDAFRRVAERVPIAEILFAPELASAALVEAGMFEDCVSGERRPQNSVRRRLSAAGELFTRTRIGALLEAREFSREACRAMVESLRVDRLIGAGRAAAVLANVIVPFALAEGRIAEVPEWLPPEDVSSPVRLAAFRLLGRDHNPATAYAKNGVKIQGLLQLYREFCEGNYPDCANCVVGGKTRC